MRLFELFTENKTREPGKFVYHATLKKNLPGIARQGLTSGIEKGYMGWGVYFAYDFDGGFFHVSRNDSGAVVLRAPWLKLVDLFGTYSAKTPEGMQRDNDQILVPDKIVDGKRVNKVIVPPHLLEVSEKVKVDGQEEYQWTNWKRLI